MVAWPLHAEQHLNKAVLVENMKMAIGVEQRDGDRFLGERRDHPLRPLPSWPRSGSMIKVAGQYRYPYFGRGVMARSGNDHH
ncbi:unnamed protein product, partial [Vitis vinifera]